MTLPTTARTHWSRVRTVVAAALLIGAVSFFAMSLWSLAGDEAPMSVIDEHVHLDTHLKTHAGTYPHRGSLMGPGLVDEWACGVGHEGGPTTEPCGSPNLGPESLPSGAYTSGYIHYPTYFVAAEGYRWVADRFVSDARPLTTYRHFAALVLSLGVVACAAVAFGLGLRGSSLVAATLVPVAASGMALFGTTANPSSAMILCGALIAGAGLRWVLSGRGFWWLAAAGVLAALVSVTASLPLGAFMLAGLGGLVARRRGHLFVGGWRPTWWQVGVLAAIAVAPVVVYGLIIDAYATQTDEVLYAFYAVPDKTTIVVGAVGELFSVHSPWAEAGGFDVGSGGLFGRSMRAISVGEPAMVNILVFGALALATLTTALTSAPATPQKPPSTDEPAPDAGRAATNPLRLLVSATLIGILLYPPALRIANAANMGVDHGIVSRYSMAFAPLVVLVSLLLLQQHRGYARALAVLATLGVIGLGVAAWQ